MSSRGRGPKAKKSNQCRKGLKIDRVSTSLILCCLHFGLSGLWGPRGPKNSFRTLFSPLWARRFPIRDSNPNMQSHQTAHLEHLGLITTQGRTCRFHVLQISLTGFDINKLLPGSCLGLWVKHGSLAAPFCTRFLSRICLLQGSFGTWKTNPNRAHDQSKPFESTS